MPQQSDPPRLLLSFVERLLFWGRGQDTYLHPPTNHHRRMKNLKEKPRGAHTGTDPSGDAGSGIAGSFVETAEAPHVGFPHPSEALPGRCGGRDRVHSANTAVRFAEFAVSHSTAAALANNGATPL